MPKISVVYSPPINKIAPMKLRTRPIIPTFIKANPSILIPNNITPIHRESVIDHRLADNISASNPDRP